MIMATVIIDNLKISKTKSRMYNHFNASLHKLWNDEETFNSSKS